METKKKIVKTLDAINVYSILAAVDMSKLKDTAKEDKYAVLRICRVLEPIAQDMENFEKKARERLKPEGFDEVVEKSQRFDSLSNEEKIKVNKAANDYLIKVKECIQPENDKEREIEIDTLSQDALIAIGEAAGLNARTLMLIEDICG